MGNQTSDTDDAVRKSYLFENATKETIPPFAAMQLVTDPSKWRNELLTPEAYSDWTLSAKKVGNAQFLVFEGNKVILFCDKPSVYSEFTQDPGQIAFNGPSPVGPRKRGKCLYGVYPVKALAPGTAFSGTVVRSSWILWPGTALNFNIGGGCFSTIGNTGQEVSVDGSGLKGPANVALTVLNPKPDRPKSSGSGTFSITGKTITKPPSKLVLKNSVIQDPQSYLYPTNSFVYGGEPTLTLNVPGLYDFTYSGTITATIGTPPELTRLDYNVAPTTWNDGGNTWQSLLYTDQDVNQHYLTTMAGTVGYSVPPLQQIISGSSQNGQVWNGGPMLPGATRAWNSVRFVMRDRILVRSTPVLIGMKQTVSPYVNVTGGTFDVRYDYEAGWRGNINLLDGYFGVFGGYYDGVGEYSGPGYWSQWRRKVTVIQPSGAQSVSFS